MRSSREADAAVASVRAEIQRLDPSLPLTKAEPLADAIGESIRPWRFSTTVVGLFAMVALGASAASVIWTVLRLALVLMAIGVGIGLAGPLALTRVMSGLLYEVRPTDAATFAIAALTLAGVALAAGPVPDWRATRVDPPVVLRTE